MKIFPVCNNNYKKNNQTFGMAIKAEKRVLKRIENSLSTKAIKKFADIIEAQKNNPIDIILSFEAKTNRQAKSISVFQAQVNGKTFGDEGLFFLQEPIIGTVEKAAKYADNQNSVKNIIKTLLNK